MFMRCGSIIALCLLYDTGGGGGGGGGGCHVFLLRNELKVLPSFLHSVIAFHFYHSWSARNNEPAHTHKK